MPGFNAIGRAPNGAFEWDVHSTASQKYLEVERETDVAVIDSVPRFLQGVAAALPGEPGMYDAMQTAGETMTALGPAIDPPYTTLHHATGALGFYQYNVAEAWKYTIAEALGIPLDKFDPKSTTTLVYEFWADLVGDSGTDIPQQILDPESRAADPASWWSPDPRLVIPSSPSRAAAGTDFFAICQIVALAPEWYAGGIVSMNVDGAALAQVRPVSFDGMTSPLWVQWPPDIPATTGGCAEELLLDDALLLGDSMPLQAYILTAKMRAALESAASVADYAQDLSKIAPGTTLESAIVARWQATIVEQARTTRARANQEFIRYLAGVGGR